MALAEECADPPPETGDVLHTAVLHKYIEQCHAIPGIQIVLLIKLMGVGLGVGHIVIPVGCQVPCPRRPKLLGLRLQTKPSRIAYLLQQGEGSIFRKRKVNGVPWISSYVFKHHGVSIFGILSITVKKICYRQSI